MKLAFARVSLLLRSARFSRRFMSTNSTVKPPNVLVLVPSRYTPVIFPRVQETLQSLLAFERYIIYPLTFTEVIGSVPWKDNCILLIIPSIPSTNLPFDILLELYNFLQMGGKCLSMNTQVTSCFHHSIGLAIDEQHYIEDKCADEMTMTILPSNSTEPFYTLNPNTVPKPHIEVDMSKWSMTVLAKAKQSNLIGKDTDQADNDHPCTWLLANPIGQCTCVASLYELMVPDVNASKMNMLEKIKESGKQRYAFLRSILGILGMDCGSTTVVMPTLSNVYLASRTENDKKEFLNFLFCKPSLTSPLSIKGTNTSAVICTDDYTRGTPVDLLDDTNESTTLVIANPNDRQLDSCHFNHRKFYCLLRTRHLGKCLLLASVVTSTQTFFADNTPLTSKLPVNSGVVFVADQQTKGRGRGDNVWISPKGCLMFSIPLVISPTARIKKKMSLLQHLVALSVVTAIRTMDSGYKDLPIMIKWPNDIYYQNKAKLGGIVVNVASLGRENYAVIGCGVNLDNQFPTVSVNDCIRLYNKQLKEPLPLLELEKTLASILNRLETYLALYEEWGFMAIEKLYYQYWMHNDANIVVSGPDGDVSAKIIGINNFGFLRVRDDKGNLLDLQPDGNTFDIMKGLIRMKTK